MNVLHITDNLLRTVNLASECFLLLGVDGYEVQIPNLGVERSPWGTLI